MQVRIKLRPADLLKEIHVEERARVSAQVGVSLLAPLALMAFVLAFWRFGVDIAWTRAFPIEQGLLSHWQVWLALAIGMQATAGWAARRSD